VLRCRGGSGRLCPRRESDTRGEPIKDIAHVPIQVISVSGRTFTSSGRPGRCYWRDRSIMAFCFEIILGTSSLLRNVQGKRTRLDCAQIERYEASLGVCPEIRRSKHSLDAIAPGWYVLVFLFVDENSSKL